jgi:3-ketosteroid 9alpha-monooxygenase subunit A
MSYRYPFTPYPNSWYRVALATDIPKGTVKPLRCFGRELVAFRGDDGKVRVTDAHCPHLGAHLGHGGQVVGNTIECPFHAWRFAGDGTCVAIPYCEKIPPLARLRTWPVAEVNGIVFVYYHADGEAPSFEIPPLSEYESNAWSDYFHLDWKIRIHIQEIAENALDLPHFAVVHSCLAIPAMNAFTIDGHRFRIHCEAPRKVFGLLSATDMDITYHGLGVVYAKVRSRPVELRVVLTSTPLDEEHLELRMAVMYNRTANPIRDAAMRVFMPGQIAKDFEHDIPIWENKSYHTRPVLCASDGPIMKIRRWAEQFYGKPARATLPLAQSECG